MNDLAPNEVRIYPKEGPPYVTPRIHLDDTMRQMEKDILKVEYPKTAPAINQPEAPAPKVVPPVNTKASLLGKILKDNKVTAGELIEWINKPKRTIEEMGIVMKGEARKTVKDAARERLNELL